MKKQLLFLSLAVAALFAGCSKNEIGAPDAPATHISAKAASAESPDTKAPLAGTSLDGRQAQVFTTTSPLEAYTGDKTKMFTDAYAAGTMTFADNSYSQYDPAGLSGKALLPMDKSEVYLYGFLPTGWTTAGAGAYESLSHTFDGKTDLMATWLTAADQTKIAYQGGASGTTPDKADLLFRHLLTRCNVQVKASDADAQAIWGRIQSVKLQTADIDKVSTGETFGYTYSAGGGAVLFYKMGGTTDAPTYSDDEFEQADFADMLALTTTYANACYTMAAPVDVDADAATAELTLVVETLDKDGGKKKTAEVPLSFDRTKLTAAAIANNTSGYSITIALNFRAGMIEASAIVEAWKDGGEQTEPVRPPKPKPEFVLTVDRNGILTCNYKMLFFQFGSVVGFTQEGDWAADKVLFNPVTGSPSYASYTGIPVYTMADFNAGHTNISEAGYHNGTNVKAGKGDPCRLVGLSAAKVQSMSAAELDAYNSGWRLPTGAESKAFTGQTAGGSYSAHWIASDSRYDKWYYSTGSAGGYFPRNSEGLQQNYLPAAGCRDTNGTTSNVGVGGYYWQKEANSILLAELLHFSNSTVAPIHGNYYASGFGARCVKEPVLTVDANGILTVNDKMLFFQFGSVVGFTQEGAWGADKVLFNPVTGSPSYATYTGIPVYAYNASQMNISASNYHNGTNIKAGKGDPCMLVGLTAAQVQSMTAAELDAYNSGWRLPTGAENQAFTGQTANGSYSAHWIASDSRYENWYYSTGSAGGYFPKGQESQKKNYLPAAGYRTTSGSTNNVGSGGYYWSSEAYNSSGGYSLDFYSSLVYPLSGYHYASGFGARCVRK